MGLEAKSGKIECNDLMYIQSNAFKMLFTIDIRILENAEALTYFDNKTFVLVCLKRRTQLRSTLSKFTIRAMELRKIE